MPVEVPNRRYYDPPAGMPEDRQEHYEGQQGWQTQEPPSQRPVTQYDPRAAQAQAVYNQRLREYRQWLQQQEAMRAPPSPMRASYPYPPQYQPYQPYQYPQYRY